MSDGTIQVKDNTGSVKNVRTFEGVVSTVTVDWEAAALVDSTGDILDINTDGSIDVNVNVSGTATLTQPSTSTTTATLAASNSARKGLTVFNDSTGNLLIAYAASATSTAYTVKVPQQNVWEMPLPIYTGAISGILDSGSGSARVTELT